MQIKRWVGVAVAVAALVLAMAATAQAAPRATLPAPGTAGGIPLAMPAHWAVSAATEDPLTSCVSTAYYAVAKTYSHTYTDYKFTNVGLAALLDTTSGIYCGKMYGYGDWDILNSRACHHFTADIINWQVGGGTTQGLNTTGSECYGSGTNFLASQTLSEPGGGAYYSGDIYADGNFNFGQDSGSYTT
jgi:hypothetical protein